MMIVKVAPDFRGELLLGTIGFPIKRGAVINLTNDQFYTDDVQLALQKKWLSAEGEFPLRYVEELEKFRVRNAANAPVSAAGIAFEKGESKLLSKANMDSHDIQSAISMKLLVLEGKFDPVAENAKIATVAKSQSAATEVLPKPVARKTRKKKVKAKTAKREKVSPAVTSDDKIAPAYRPDEPTTTLQAWDGPKEKLVSKDEIAGKQPDHVKKVEQTIPSEDGVQAGDIDFSKVDELAEKLENTSRKKVKKRSRKKKKGSAKAIKAVGTIRPAPTDAGMDSLFDPNSLPNESGDISFVDNEQETARKSHHPRLASLNDAVELDLDAK